MIQVITKQEAKATGAKRFFTGEPCINGHMSERRLIGGGCCECLAAVQKAWRTANPEKMKECKDRWNSANTEKMRITVLAYTAANKDAIASKKKEYRANNPDKIREDKRLYRERHPEKVSAQLKEWRGKNPEKNRESRKSAVDKNPDLYKRLGAEAASRRYAHVKIATPKWANKVIMRLIHKDAKMLGLTVDHIIPYMGATVCGLNVENNLQLLTALENSLKSSSFNPEDHETTLERIE